MGCEQLTNLLKEQKKTSQKYDDSLLNTKIKKQFSRKSEQNMKLYKLNWNSYYNY